MLLAGLDVGTTSVGGVLLDGERGTLLAATSIEHHAACAGEHPWERLQDADVLLAAAREVLARLSAGRAGVRGVAVTGQMHGIVYVDRAGRAVSRLATWQDQRGARPGPDGRSHVEALAARTGHALATGFGLVTHHHDLQHGGVPATAVALCTIADYVAMQLAGRGTVPPQDPSQAAALGLFDRRAGAFDAQALQRAGIDPAWLPPPGAAGAYIGQAADGAAVFCAPGDNQAGFLGAVREAPAAVLVNVGTSGQVSVYTRDAAPVDGLELRPFPGGFLQVGAALCGGTAYAALERCLRRTCQVFAGYDGPPLYAAMERLAAAALPAGAGRLAVDTRLLGSRDEPQRRGAITGVSLDNFTPEQLILGFLQGITDELGALYARLPEAERARRRYLVGCGNGLRLNPTLCRLLAERFGLPLSIPVHAEEAAFGAALCAGVGLGLYPDLVAAGRIIRYR